MTFRTWLRITYEGLTDCIILSEVNIYSKSNLFFDIRRKSLLLGISQSGIGSYSSVNLDKISLDIVLNDHKFSLKYFTRNIKKNSLKKNDLNFRFWVYSSKQCSNMKVSITPVCTLMQVFKRQIGLIQITLTYNQYVPTFMKYF